MLSEKSFAETSSTLRFRTRTSCPVCESPETDGHFDLNDYLHGIKGRFGYDRCGRCRTVYQNPCVVPEDLGQCYPAAYFTHFNPIVGSSPPQPDPTGLR